METLEELREKYNNLNKERLILYKKIAEAERKEVARKFTVGECYLNTCCNSFTKIILIDNQVLHCVVVTDGTVSRDRYCLNDTKCWKKITSEQFKDIYLAVIKDIQVPDIGDNKSYWDVTLESIEESLNKESNDRR
nr:MAG TPA: hypothetical protein [Bacteriophage sp.]